MQNMGIQYARGVCGLEMSPYVRKGSLLHKAYQKGKKDKNNWTEEQIEHAKTLNNVKREKYLASVKITN